MAKLTVPLEEGERGEGSERETLHFIKFQEAIKGLTSSLLPLYNIIDAETKLLLLLTVWSVL
jgi:hypothetical protein